MKKEEYYRNCIMNVRDIICVWFFAYYFDIEDLDNLVLDFMLEFTKIPSTVISWYKKHGLISLDPMLVEDAKNADNVWGRDISNWWEFFVMDIESLNLGITRVALSDFFSLRINKEITKRNEESRSSEQVRGDT